jgi:hypothetical protein
LLAFHSHFLKQFLPSEGLRQQCAPNHTAFMRMTWFNLCFLNGNCKMRNNAVNVLTSISKSP